MIVTRHRRRRHQRRYLIPLVIVAVLAGLFTWPPSQRLIANGPLQPAYNGVVNAANAVARPLTFAGQQQTIADRNREIRDLNARLEQQRVAKVDADTRAEHLQQQVTALSNQPHVSPVPAPRPSPGTAFGLAASRGGAAASEDERRLAATWAAMEPEKAAAIVQRLPDTDVTRVLAQMDADSAGAIMNALPPNVAARISRAVAQVPPAAGR